MATTSRQDHSQRKNKYCGRAEQNAANADGHGLADDRCAVLRCESRARRIGTFSQNNLIIFALTGLFTDTPSLPTPEMRFFLRTFIVVVLDGQLVLYFK
jgi:hypothetical protein